MKHVKTHYITLRVVFDKPCDAATAVKSVQYGLTREKQFPTRSFYSRPVWFNAPSAFSVRRVLHK